MRSPRDRRHRENRSNRPRQGEVPGGAGDLGQDRAKPSSGISRPEREDLGPRGNPEREDTVDDYDGRLDRPGANDNG